MPQKKKAAEPMQWGMKPKRKYAEIRAPEENTFEESGLWIEVIAGIAHARRYSRHRCSEERRMQMQPGKVRQPHKIKNRREINDTSRIFNKIRRNSYQG